MDPSSTTTEMNFYKLQKIHDMYQRAGHDWGRQYFLDKWRGAGEARAWAEDQLARYVAYRDGLVWRERPVAANVVQVIADLSRLVQEPK